MLGRGSDNPSPVLMSERQIVELCFVADVLLPGFASSHSRLLLAEWLHRFPVNRAADHLARVGVLLGLHPAKHLEALEVLGTQRWDGIVLEVTVFDHVGEHPEFAVLLVKPLATLGVLLVLEALEERGAVVLATLAIVH